MPGGGALGEEVDHCLGFRVYGFRSLGVDLLMR